MPSRDRKTGRFRAAARRSHKPQSRAKPQDEGEENTEETRRDTVQNGKPNDTKRKTSEAQQRQGPDSKRRETTADQDSNALINSFQVAQHARETSPGPSTRPIQPIMLGKWAEATPFDPPKDDRSGLSIQHRRAVQRNLQTASQAPMPRTSTSSLSMALGGPAYHQQTTQRGTSEQAAPTWSASKYPGGITPPFPTSTNQLEATHVSSLPREPQPNPFLSQPVASTYRHASPRRTSEQEEHMMERQRMLRQRNVDRDDPRLRQTVVDAPVPFLASPTQRVASNSRGLTQAGRFAAPSAGAGAYGENKPTPSGVLRQRANLAPVNPVRKPGYLPPRIAGSENRRSSLGSAVRLVQFQEGTTRDTNGQQSGSRETLWPGEPPASMAQPLTEAPYSLGGGSGWLNELRRREAAAREMQWDRTPLASTSASARASSTGTQNVANTAHGDDFEDFTNALIEYEQTSGKTVSPGGLQYSSAMAQPLPSSSYFARSDAGSPSSDAGTYTDATQEKQWADTPDASFTSALASSNNVAPPLDAHMSAPSSSSLDPSQSLGTEITLDAVQEAFARRRAWQPEADMFAGHCWLGFVGEDGFIRSFDPPRPCDGTCESHRILKQGLGEYR
ncbi:uncharacterized protein TRAVEDRAFT_51696 [Trametes versicolor FP-101664 SS1]|uniref:uncharacterized protein n=1 Tax=Trametes versicolor (strain FP-101664) TaxID=717944 RepID=UPI0004622DEE|nr:uncharacterized protein TRAVEDRAFT_51696 [Trametes versicolor FP-101664 SS1]EIW53958.1 hypothetical protein TRAVEDRAFT_51696 [Trametes versicolor FP-101664 SS1]